MKTLNTICWMALFALVVVGCSSKTEDLLPKKGGTWKTTSVVYTSYVNSALDSTWTDPQTYTYFFEKTGPATITDNAGTRGITWYVNPQGDIMTTCTNTPTSQVCDQYLIVETSSKAQTWKQTINGAVNGNWIEKLMKLARVE